MFYALAAAHLAVLDPTTILLSGTGEDRLERLNGHPSDRNAFF